MELLLDILNKSGYIFDMENAQIIDINNKEVGIISSDENLVTYSFSDGRKIIFDKTNNQITIDVSNNLSIIFKFTSKPHLNKFLNEVDQINEFYITLNMKLSNGTTCSLECYHQQHSSCITDYEVRFYHHNIEYDKSISFSRYYNSPNGIVYNNENGIIDYTGMLDSTLYNIEGISQQVENNFLRPLIIESGIIDDNEIEEIIGIISNGLNIINYSLDRLVELFLFYDFSEENEIPFGKIKLLNKYK